jgi:ribosome biogenesis GTPase
MAKRRLSEQQTRRIRDQQSRRATRAQQGETTGDGGLGPEQAGLVISHFGRALDVEVLEGAQRGEIVRCRMRSNLGALVTGDRVIWRPRLDGDGGVIVACVERQSLLARPDAHSGLPRPVAANIDQILVVVAPRPEPFANLIDRYLVAAEACGIEPILLLNKSDLLGDGSVEREEREALEALLAGYRDIGYHVLRASTVDRRGLDALRARLDGRTSVFVGQSGVGKSSLIAALLPGAQIRIGELSQAVTKGRHTTTTARLYHLPGGGDLIDSPGIREFGVGHLTRADIEAGFRELRPLLGRCRFRDCRHTSEPGCAIRAAEESGTLSLRRSTSLRMLLAEAGQ